MSEPVEPAPTVRRDRLPAARSVARRRKANRERRVVSLPNRGVSVAELAAREGVTERGMRKYVRSVLARRAPGQNRMAPQAIETPRFASRNGGYRIWAEAPTIPSPRVRGEGGRAKRRRKTPFGVAG